ncbi:MAG: DUF4421 family protein [Bacteroidetes bacterium]|nr:DUF4421 family protein [Bacteroidota bacterium]MBK9414023.1 DUF4421 family protein [Bacteroidota bacterium]MBL0034098.1 DUF4421 family protein [Bacteroidota bacterium]MBP6427202.1 DUF4421 family protein [Bacteroidia bacterium]MBP6656855.1 DUF4421 family protein [Bacteroidia bacterium]
MSKLKFIAKSLILIFILTTSSLNSFAQFDTLYAIKYPSKLGLSIFQSKPSYQIDITQKMSIDTSGLSPIRYSTLAKNVTGIGFFYDKISLFVGFRSPINQDERIRKGRTNYSQLGFAITGVKLRIEGSLRSYKGFYDINSVNYIPDFTDSSAYFQNSYLVNRSLRAKAFYFLNRKKRFSYGAAYVNNVRQLKSAGSFIVATNLYHYSLNSPSIVPTYIQDYYGDWKKLNMFNVTAVTAGVGYTHTLTIFKRAFINVLFTLGLEEQHIITKSSETNKSLNIWRSQVSAFDFRSSFGFNSKEFFISIQNIVDGNNYRLSMFDVTNVYVSTFLNIGYRFPVKTPAFYKRIQDTKVYKAI